MAKKSDPLKVVTPECRISYPNLFVARMGPDGGEPKFSCSLVFEEGADLSELEAAVIRAAQEKWGDKALGMIKAKKLRLPFRTDGEEKGYPENSVFINCSSKQAPGLVGPYAGPDGRPEDLYDEKEWYPGARVRAAIRAFAYDARGNKGVSFGLNNLQKVGEGERFDSRVSAADEFEALGARPKAALVHDEDEDEEDDGKVDLGSLLSFSS
jgi:hypothetical protein